MIGYLEVSFGITSRHTQMAKSCPKSNSTFEVVEAGGGGFCSVHSMEYILSGKIRAGKDYIERYREWATANGSPFPTDINFKRWSTNDWSSPVSMFDMWIAKSMKVPFIIHDPKARSGKVYTLAELFKLLDKKQHEKLTDSVNPTFIVGTGMHWMPIKAIESSVVVRKVVISPKHTAIASTLSPFSSRPPITVPKKIRFKIRAAPPRLPASVVV